MKNLLLTISAALMSATMAGSAVAADVTGTWEGSFTGVTLGEAPRFGPTTPLAIGGMDPEGPRPEAFEMERRIGPSAIETEVTANVVGQHGDQFYGTWSDGVNTYRFVCTMTGEESIICTDEQGVATGSVSDGEMNICYLQTGVLEESAGCATLRKAS